jgi:hypothetical protein
MTVKVTAKNAIQGKKMKKEMGELSVVGIDIILLMREIQNAYHDNYKTVICRKRLAKVLNLINKIRHELDEFNFFKNMYSEAAKEKSLRLFYGPDAGKIPD